MLDEGYVTWEILTSFAGAAAMTSLIVQLLKKLIDRYLNIPTQIISYLVAVIILTLGMIFTDGFTINKMILILFNAILVSTSSNGIYDGIRRVTKR